jgi:hypothetical protein
MRWNWKDFVAAGQSGSRPSTHSLSHNKQRQTLGIIKIKVLGFFCAAVFANMCSSSSCDWNFPRNSAKVIQVLGNIYALLSRDIFD